MSYTLEMHEEFDCPRTAEDAFDYITDFSRIDEWDHTIISSKKTSSGGLGLGTQFALVYSMGLRKVPIDYEITVYEPNTCAVLVGRSQNFMATDTVTITESDNGCHVSWHAKLDFFGAASKVVPLIKGKVTKAGKQTIKHLASALQDNNPVPTLGVVKTVADKLIAPGLLGFTKYGFTHAKKHWKPTSNSIKGNHIVITGATSGLGLATAHQLAHRGAHLTLVARNAEKASAVAKQISQASGNNNIALEIADLSEMDQVIGLANNLLSIGRPIDVLINNAGALLNPRQENSAGIESSFALLLLGPVILTEMLKPLLTRPINKRIEGKAQNIKQDHNNGVDRNQPISRVINVSSGGMYAKRISVSNLESTKGDYSGADAYARAKRGLVIRGEYWAKQWVDDGIVVHNMHPGWAKTPGVEQSLPEFNRKMQKVLRTPEQGADTIIWLACASEATCTSGRFWLDREPHSTHLSNKTRETPEQRASLFLSLKAYAEKYNVTLDAV